MKLEIEAITVIVSDGHTDRVIIACANLPASVYPYNGSGDLMMYVANGHGAQYVRDNFNFEPEVITLSH